MHDARHVTMAVLAQPAKQRGANVPQATEAKQKDQAHPAQAEHSTGPAEACCRITATTMKTASTNRVIYRECLLRRRK